MTYNISNKAHCPNCGYLCTKKHKALKAFGCPDCELFFTASVVGKMASRVAISYRGVV